MQVILKSDVDHLGYAGDVVDVRRGYWRNFLRPRGHAEIATPNTITQMLARMERRRAAEARNEGEAKELQGLLNRTVLTIAANAGPSGKLFGSVTAADVARAIESARKLRLDPKKIALEEPIKALGTFMVPVNVFPGVRAEIKTMVIDSGEEPPPEGEVEAVADTKPVVSAEESDVSAEAPAEPEAEVATDVVVDESTAGADVASE